YFGPESWPSSQAVSPEQIENRMLLQKVMLKHGFKPLKEEWWHFTLKNEPYPKTYFDFPVR
ncbi:MAG: peptidase M15, partial [Bacteroidetes bacterium]|nr:peptidase M15 [Bacteroidota bacterium]